MITYKLGDSARLGNQMFCIAAVYGYAQLYNEEPQFQPYKYFNLPALKCQPENFYKEEDGVFNPIPYKPNLQIEGYFQDERYFIHARDKVLKVFGFNQNTCDFVGIHVRRGDYILYPTKFIVKPIDYYRQAMNMLGSNYDYMVISDDISWCKKQFKNSSNVMYYEGSELSSIELMSRCKHNIISASSFSWWGAWLNTNKDKRVIAPKQWWGEEWKWKNDPCLKSWYRI